MRTIRDVLTIIPVLCGALCNLVRGETHIIPDGSTIDAEVRRIMARTRGNGLAVAVIDGGKVQFVRAYGIRNAAGDPLTADTIMYGAPLTKTVFAYTVMQLVDQGRLHLDTPIRNYLEKPLPSYGPDPVFPDKYGPYKDLSTDSRWGEDYTSHVPDPFNRFP